MIDAQVPARAYEERVTAATAVGIPARRESKEGRVVYLPTVDFDGPLPQFAGFFPVDARYWRAPRNAAEIADSVRWAARDRIPVEVSGPDYLVSNLVEHPGNRRLMLHLVNYNSRKEASLDPIQVTIRLPEGLDATQGVLYSPDFAGPQELAGTRTQSGITFTVPIKTYSIVAVNW